MTVSICLNKQKNTMEKKEGIYDLMSSYKR
jgi:hypothetical protein